jgi:hypothetical protein
MTAPQSLGFRFQAKKVSDVRRQMTGDRNQMTDDSGINSDLKSLNF